MRHSEQDIQIKPYKIIAVDDENGIIDSLSAGAELKLIVEKIQELKAEGKTILLSTHIFSLVEKLCDRVGIVMDGRMILCDTLENLTKDGDLEDKFFQICEEMEAK